MRYIPAAIAVLVLGVPLCAKEPAKSSGGGINWYSKEREMALGKQLAAEVERQVKLADDPILSEYVNRLAQNLARNAELSVPVSVRIIESGDTNAFSLPGGHIYINSGMLKLTESEAELAFVLAHELGHTAARHGTREATRDQLLQLGSLPLGILGGWTGQIARELASPGTRLAERKLSRDFETEADLLGVDILDSATYDLQSSVDMLERIEAQERKTPGRIARAYGSHPLTSSRIAKTQQHIEAMAVRRDEYILNTSEYESMRLRVVALEAKREAETSRTGPTQVVSDN